ncbi:PREDICTED: crossover junction endonuclease MUS81 [Dufourea novaeangliae]|uniref:crossover junction endonuclease MUS81 n=1 Tax=Dufourea novaeangliae TaxID=178035 RepID=UPI000767DB97|nr:PREDICTED: crossover junction endonuclease MUS81 [Dufourea novaeangliae]
MKRVKLKLKRPNPLFEVWLEEWREEAASRNSNLQYNFSEALTSLKKYPLPLKSGKDCIILQHFGTKLCLMLDRKLEKYKAENGNLVGTTDSICLRCNHTQEHVSKRKQKSQHIAINLDRVHERTEPAVFDKLDLSKWNLENYAVLLILYKKAQDPCFPGLITEVELLLEIKNLCGHASKDSVSNLFDNGLVSMIGAPVRYSLTEQGINIAKIICEITTMDAKQINSSDNLNEIQLCLKSRFGQKLVLYTDITSLNNKYINPQSPKECHKSTYDNLNKSSHNIQKSQSLELINNGKTTQHSNQYPVKQKINGKNVVEKPKTTKNAKKDASNKESGISHLTDHATKQIYIESNKFDIILLVDTQETCGGKTKPQHDATIVELSQLGVLFEVRHLKVGDFAWIARCRDTKAELILPYIIERKRIDDLSASITDGRFHEQKFRLKQSGIENLMYIIEEYDKEQRLTIPHSSLMQASINILIQDGFSIKYTKTHKHSMFYLSSLTRIFNDVFKEKSLIGCKKEFLTQTNKSSNTVNLMEFEEFNKAASKQKVFKVNQMFIRQLLQLKGLSVDKAFAIVERYPTPRILVDAFQQSDCSGELLLSNIEFGNKNRLLGPTISKTLYQLYTKKILN